MRIKLSIDKNSTQYEFVELLKQNIKNSIETKGDNNMENTMVFPDDTIRNIGKTTSQKEPLKSEVNSFPQQPRQTINSNPIPQQPKQEKANPNVNHQRSHTPQQTGNSISYSDFEKLKEDITQRIDKKISELDYMFQNKMESFDTLNNSFEMLIEKLNHTSNVYNEINAVVEKINTNNKEYLIEVKEQLERHILKVLQTLQGEITKTDEFVEDFLKNKNKNKKTTDNSYSFDDEDDYNNDDDEDEVKPSKNDDDEDDDIFTKKKEDKSSEKKLSLMGKLFKKIGL